MSCPCSSELKSSDSQARADAAMDFWASGERIPACTINTTDQVLRSRCITRYSWENSARDRQPSIRILKLSILVPKTHRFQSGAWPRTICGSLLRGRENNVSYRGLFDRIHITRKIRRQKKKHYKDITSFDDGSLAVLHW